mgnify:CR=1 FL=1
MSRWPRTDLIDPHGGGAKVNSTGTSVRWGGWGGVFCEMPTAACGAGGRGGGRPRRTDMSPRPARTRWSASHRGQTDRPAHFNHCIWTLKTCCPAQYQSAPTLPALPAIPVTPRVRPAPSCTPAPSHATPHSQPQGAAAPPPPPLPATSRRSAEPHSAALLDLPLWRADSTVLVGQQSLLHIHTPLYVHMFDALFAQSPCGPWYFGHVRLPGGSRNLGAAEWELCRQGSCAPHVGVLMEVNRAVRLEDGKLMVIATGVARIRVGGSACAFWGLGRGHCACAEGAGMGWGSQAGSVLVGVAEWGCCLVGTPGWRLVAPYTACFCCTVVAF